MILYYYTKKNARSQSFHAFNKLDFQFFKEERHEKCRGEYEEKVFDEFDQIRLPRQKGEPDVDDSDGDKPDDEPKQSVFYPRGVLEINQLILNR